MFCDFFRDDAGSVAEEDGGIEAVSPRERS